MATLIKTPEGYKDTLPQIFIDDYWTPMSSWVFANGLWRRTFDPGFVNLINNSRLLNGTDISVTQGKIVGLAPVDWTLGTFPTGNGYSYGRATQQEQVIGYRFVSEQSRHYYVSRVQVEAGQDYIASAYIDEIVIKNNLKVLQVVGETASISIDVDFPASRDIQKGIVWVKFTARTSGLVQFKIGAGVDNYGDADVSISRPQITRSMSVIDWQPTPIVAPFYGVRLLNSYFKTEEVVVTTNGDYSFDSTLRVENEISNPIRLFGRNDASGFSGVAFSGTHLYVYRSGSVDRSSSFSKSIPINQLIGLKVIWKKTSNYINDVRFYLNGELIGRIDSTLYSGNVDSMFGSEFGKTDNITVQSLSANLGRVLAFNIDEAEGNILWDRNKLIKLIIDGDPMVDFIWVEDSSPPIIITEASEQVADIGDEVRFFADAVFYSSVQWYKDNIIIPGATNVELKFIVKEEDYGVYHATFKNEFAVVDTSRVRLKRPNDETETLVTEDLISVVTENEKIITTEG